MAQSKTLYRNTDNKVIAGVCSGLADYFKADVNLVRIVAVILGITGPGLIAYLVGMIVIPEKPKG